MRTATVAAAMLALAAIVLGCGSPAPIPAPIQVDNRTDTAVGLYVNDGWAGTYAAGATGSTSLGGHGDPPYTIEVRTPSNAVLLTVGVNEAQAASLDQPDGAVAEEIGVPCGVVRVVVGTLADGTAPAPAESVPPGPCP